VGQALTALKMDLAWLGKKVPPRGKPVREKLRGMEGVIDATMDALHRILAELRPGVLDDLGLPRRSAGSPRSSSGVRGSTARSR